MHIKVIGTE